jgi:hypothetical protein
MSAGIVCRKRGRRFKVESSKKKRKAKRRVNRGAAERTETARWRRRGKEFSPRSKAKN